MIAWQRYLLGCTVAIVGQYLLPAGLIADIWYVVVAGSGAGAVVVGVRRNHPTHPVAWHCLAAGLGVWVLGLVVRLVLSALGVVEPAVSVVDVLQLLAYPLFAVGLWILVRSRGPERFCTAMLDTAMATVALGLLSWVYRIQPALTAVGTPLVDRIVAIAYPLGGVLFAAMLVRLALAPSVRNTSAQLVIAAVGAMFVAESIGSAATYVPALAAHLTLLGPCWLAAYVLWGAAALNPSMIKLSVPAPPTKHDGRLMLVRQVGLALAGIVGPAVLMGELVAGVPLHAWPVAIATTVLVLLTFARMTEVVRHERQQAELLVLLADTDYVTGLANRRRFAERLGAFLAGADGTTAVLLLIDLDRLAKIRDTLGDRTGDEILRGIGDRLRALVGPGVLISRTGEHAFAILVRSVGWGVGTDPGLGARRVREALELPFELAQLNVSVEVTIGSLLLPDDGATPSIALHRADLALAAAKVRPERTARYGTELDAGDSRAPLLIGELPGALENHDILVHYQPQVDLATGLVFGVEALARWQHPRHGLLGPDLFIGAAERTELIGPFTHYILDRALAQNARWRSDGLELTVAVNLSVRNLLDPGLLDVVRSCLDRYGLDPRVLELEITETSAMVDTRRSMEVLGTLADMGVTLSIDDYGTGHSSLAYLQRLPVQRLKIDRSFVTNILTDPASAAIVASTIELARHLRLSVVAEGVEDDATMLRLRELDCPAVQGFGIGRPVAAPLVPALVRAIEQRVPRVLGVGVVATRA